MILNNIIILFCLSLKCINRIGFYYLSYNNELWIFSQFFKDVQAHFLFWAQGRY